MKLKKYKKSGVTVGVLFSKMRNEWNRNLAQGIKDTAFENGVNVIQYCNGGLQHKNSESSQFNIIGELIDTDKLDALIINNSAFGPHLKDHDCEVFCRKFTSIPIILLNKQLGSFFNISYDDCESVVIAARHLVEVHQYYNIALMRRSVSSNYQLQLKAFRNTLNSLNIPVNNKFIINDIPRENQNAELLAVLYKLMENGAEAIIAGETVARQVIYVLTNAGVKIPSEIAVLGLNNQISSEFTVPPLSSIERSFYKLGRLAVEKIISLLNGKSLEKNIKLNPFLVRRSSCGCFNQPVHEITESISGENISTRKGEFLDIKNEITEKMREIIGHTREDLEFTDNLLKAYADDLKNPGEYIFLNFLQKILKKNINIYISPNVLQKILTLLINMSLPFLKSREKLIHMQFTWQQARLFINDYSLHNQSMTIFQNRIHYEDYRLFSQKLLSTFELKELLEVMVKELSGNRIPFAYLVLYENPKPYKYPGPIPRWSRLVMAYTENGRIEINEAGLHFQTKHFLPDNIWQNYFIALKNNYFCIVESLAIEGQQLGYMVLGLSGKLTAVSYWLKNVVSISLQGALNYKQLHAQSK